MSETDFLKLKKHDNVETNTEKFDIENYLNGNWDKINENAKEVNTNISNINSKNTELETELKEIQEDFYQNSIRGQASGEYIHVEDSSNCRAKIGIGGNSEQEVVTDNLFNNTWKQGIIASETGVEIDSTENIRSSSVEVHTNHLYSISRSIYTSYMSFRFYTKDGVYLGNQLTEGIMTASNTDKRMNANESSMTFTITNANVARMRIVDNSNNLTTKYTLTTDTINPDYPSEIKAVGSNGCVKITKCNKNLFDKDNAIKEYELDGNTGKIMSNSLYFTSDYIRVNPNEQYYLSGKNTGNSNCFYNKDKKFISKINLENGLLTVPDDLNIYYLRINSRLTAIDTTMLEKNTKKSAYEEHQEQSYIMPIQQPMRSIGDIRDTFIKKENKWYERHYIARRIFNGIANKFNSKHSSIYTDTRGFYLLNLPGKILGTNGSVAYGKSNYLKYKNGNAMDAIYQDCLWWENTSNYNYASIPFLSLTEANEWLVKLNDNGNPFYIDYVLAEPLDIECTEEQSNILDELNNARTYKNVTNITTDSKAILSLDYAKDLETLLNNTQALAVNNASEGV